ncbi:MAG: substrate-binding domain-containing protein [Pseudomonadota bacterium]
MQALCNFTGYTKHDDALLSGSVDLGITASSPADRTLGHAPIATERLVPVATPQWVEQHAGHSQTLRAVRTSPAVSYDRDLALISRALEAEGLRTDDLRPSIVVPDLLSVRDLVREGAGWSVIPDYLVEHHLATGDLIRLRTRSALIKNTLYLVWLKTALRHPRVSFARQIVLESFGK